MEKPHVSMEKCPEYSHILGSPLRTEKKTIFDISPPQKIRVTEYDLDVYRCSICGTEVKAKHRDYPQTCDMGIYLLNYIAMLKLEFRMKFIVSVACRPLDLHVLSLIIGNYVCALSWILGYGTPRLFRISEIRQIV
ncbi:MAG: hypothetical protein ACP5NK_00745 [Thermoplasmata archaeon]